MMDLEDLPNLVLHTKYEFDRSNGSQDIAY
jgi:hypothetical protein